METISAVFHCNNFSLKKQCERDDHGCIRQTQANREGRMSPTGENATTKQARLPVGKRTRLQLRQRLKDITENLGQDGSRPFSGGRIEAATSSY